ncbi:MAG TPA: BBP7 family outer membrane beta-barrel protein, partial [Gemmataceae bacterium]|nr:BBP7 family outer membrane beta-barrel protein [Gemmataceae bacterium]
PAAIGSGTLLPTPSPAADGVLIPAGPAPGDPYGGLWFSGEYLLWTARGGVPQEVGALLSTGGVPHQLFGSLPMRSYYSGLRASAGWSAPDRDFPGFDLGGFFLETGRGSLASSVISHPALHTALVPNALILQPVVNGVIVVPGSRGIVDTPIPGPDGQLDLDASDTLTSGLRGTSKRTLWGLEANARSLPIYYGPVRLDGLVGFRHLSLREQLTLQGDYTFAEPPAGGDPDETADNPEDGHTNVMHTFDTLNIQNRFYGAQVGTTFEARLGEGLVVSGFAKVAVGGNEEHVTAVGSTVLDATTIETHAGGPFIPRPTQTLPGGLLTPATPVAIRSSHFTALTELNINLGYQVTSFLETYVGYNYLYMNSVARLGDQFLTAGGKGQGHLDLSGVDFGVRLRY